MIIPIELDNGHVVPTHPNACLPHQRELRAGWVVTPPTLEDDLPPAIYVSDLSPSGPTVTRLDILSFEFVAVPARGPQPPGSQPQGFWQVTYRACIEPTP